MVHTPRARECGWCGEILERKAAEPGRRVVLIAHSAGCAVALAACDELPIDAVDRVILLAPSVSTGYDIRPTLWSAKEGVDVFCSKKDWVALGFVVKVVGTTDNFWSGSAAGRLGFKPKKTNGLAELETSRLAPALLVAGCGLDRQYRRPSRRACSALRADVFDAAHEREAGGAVGASGP